MSNQTIVQEVKHLLSTGQRASISTKTFEKIIELLEQKEKALDEISDIADENLCDDDCDECPDNCICDWKEIKDIINEAKE